MRARARTEERRRPTLGRGAARPVVAICLRAFDVPDFRYSGLNESSRRCITWDLPHAVQAFSPCLSIYKSNGLLVRILYVLFLFLNKFTDFWRN